MHSPNHPWQHSCRWIYRVMPGIDRMTLYQLTELLPVLQHRGFDTIQITAPYASAGPYPWWGLRPSDPFQMNAALSCTYGEFCAFADLVHDRGMHLMVFLNPGYDDVTSLAWKKACMDHRAGIRSFEEQRYIWRHPLEGRGRRPPYGPCFPLMPRYGQWVYEPAAADEYFCKWDGTEYGYPELREPQYNWKSPAFLRYMEDVMYRWLETGVDGIILDAVNFYGNCSFDTLKSFLAPLRRQYPGVLFIPEGAGGFGEDPELWLADGLFAVMEDQLLDSDLHWNGSLILKALQTGDDTALRRRLAYERKLRSRGITFWSYPSWGRAWTREYRLEELRILRDNGHMVEWLPSYHLPWPDQL